MNYLDFAKDELLTLNEDQLEQLIGRLAEAEVASHGASIASVYFSGSITASDGGVDVRVVLSEPIGSGFIPRANTIFQAKINKMPAGDITNEMLLGGNLRPAIAQLCEEAGSYIIVSLKDDCTDTMRKGRLKAMNAAVADQPQKQNIHIDFFDRSKLHQWLRQHPSVILWVRMILGKPLSGWRSYGKWSYVPADGSDSLIEAPGVSVVLPQHQQQRFTISEALIPARQMISNSNKSIRVAGLSGVGKTRFVQALFDEKNGDHALDRTIVIYTDTGANPVPSARQMIDELILNRKPAIVVIDNCPNDLHSDLANQITSSTNQIKLITVEYDIRDDKPNTTEMIYIEAVGPGLAEALLLRRYPRISQANAHRIAEFAGGNARVALAVGEHVVEGESLAKLSDANLFNRLFKQRHYEDGLLRKHAEVLSLVYSFSVEPDKDEPEELQVLALLSGYTIDALFHSSEELVARNVAQKRGQWRAILPHAIANWLTASALNHIQKNKIIKIFEDSKNQRLLSSFAHRLGLMHDHPVARDIVQSWLTDGGLLVPVIALNDRKAKLLDFIAPVCPDLLLDRIETELSSEQFTGFDRNDPQRSLVQRLLVSLSYDSIFFDRSIKLLLKIFHFEEQKDEHNSGRAKIISLFQPYLSGTHATPEQRSEILKEVFWSADPKLRQLGAQMLANALDGPPWTGLGIYDFGARPRDYGYQPNYGQFLDWLKLFIDVAREAALNGDNDLRHRARDIFAQEFRGLWSQTGIRSELINSAKLLNKQSPWIEGWKAVIQTINYYYRKKDEEEVPEPVPEDLLELRDILMPKDLISNIQAHLFGRRNDASSFDVDFDQDDPTSYTKAEARLAERVTEFGRQFTHSGMDLNLLCPQLFSADWIPFGHSFGSGLAKGAHDMEVEWEKLVAALKATEISHFNTSVFSGFLDQAGKLKYGLDRKLLHGCLNDDLLRSVVPRLCPMRDFSDDDMDRCIFALQHEDAEVRFYGDLLWRDTFESVNTDKRVALAQTIMGKPNGDEVLLDALSMRLHNKDMSQDILGLELRRLGLLAAISRLGKGSLSKLDFHMARVLADSLNRAGNEAEKLAWLDAIFKYVDTHYGYSPHIPDSLKVTVTAMLEEFLSLVFMGTDKQKERRRSFLRYSFHRKSLLASSDMSRIINWCKSTTDHLVWEGVAGAIDLFQVAVDVQPTVVSEQALQFLEACPNPELVLQAYAKNIWPVGGWTGSRAAIVEQNVAAFEVFAQSKDIRVATEAQKIMSKALIDVKREKDQELSMDAKRDQRFE